MEIITLEVSGFRSCFEALRLPYKLPHRSRLYADFKIEPYNSDRYYESIIELSTKTQLHKKDMALLSALVKRGPEHAKCIRGINVYAKITAPIYWWCEMETYTIGHYRLASESTMHIDCKSLTGEELVKAKSEIFMGKKLTKIDMFNYQNLRNIYFQRRNHELPEWKIFCNWIEQLPYSKEFITIE